MLLSLFQNWVSWATSPDSGLEGNILEFALGHLYMLETPALSNKKLEIAVQAVGISDELSLVLLDPEFAQIFSSEKLLFWLEDTIKMRYQTLEDLLIKLKNEAIRRLRKKNKNKRPNIIGAFDEQPTATNAESSVTVTASAPSDIELLPSAFVVIESQAPPIRPDHHVWYKGRGVISITNPLFHEDGSINMLSIKTEMGGDFNQARIAWYFTPEKETAKLYRAFTAKRVSYAETWNIQFQVLASFLDTLHHKSQLWYSRDWKEFVWRCRNGLAAKMPAKFDRFAKPGLAQLIKGHICGRHPHGVNRIDIENVQTSLDESHLLYINGGTRRSTQTVIVDEGVAERMGELIRGKIHIEVHPPRAAAKN
ncbi:hypothetical protein BUE80_DR002702 [Diplocarpon rosae]|nr:hypothetical protein BUE80_DR002702 [Diplocarpon rosae]